MTSLVNVLIYSALLIINLVLLVPVVFRRNKARIDYVYIVMASLIILWQAIDIALLLARDPTMVAFLYQAHLAPVAFILLAFFYLVVLYYNKQRAVPQWFGLLLLIGSIIVAVLLLTSDYHDLIWVGSIDVEALTPVVHIEETPNVGYFIALAFSQIPIFGIAVIVLSQRKKLPTAYRAATTILIWCLIVYALSVVANVLGLLRGTGLDPGLLGACLINFFIYVAIVSKSRADYLNVWQGDVYDYLEEAILILNDKKEIVDANKTAKRLFGFLGLSFDGVNIDDLLKQVSETGRAFLRQLENGDSTTVARDLYLTDGEYPIIYEVQQSKLEDVSLRGSGELLVLTEVTRNRLYIERLRDLAGVDALTGLPNRFSYEQMLHAWDRPENLPLSIIVGDLNDLKKLNDTYGHQIGDKLLIRASEILKSCCPSEGMVARVGGDEFVMLLKNTNEEKTAQVIQAIGEAAEEENEFPHLVSMALGSATKNHAEENMNSLYVQADAHMYANKKAGGAK